LKEPGLGLEAFHEEVGKKVYFPFYLGKFSTVSTFAQDFLRGLPKFL